MLHYAVINTINDVSLRKPLDNESEGNIYWILVGSMK